MLLASQILMWAVVLVLVCAVLMLARQIGVLHERIAPVGALALGAGPQPGEMAPRVLAEALNGSTIVIGGPAKHETRRILLFVAPSCPVCKKLLPTIRSFSEAERVNVLLVGDGDAAQHLKMADKFGIDHARFVNSSEVGMAYRISKLPYAVLLADDGTIASQGLVNTREHLESLIVSQERGIPSIQNFLAHRRNAAETHLNAERTHRHV